MKNLREEECCEVAALCPSCSEAIEGPVFDIEEGKGCALCKIAELQHQVRDFQEKGELEEHLTMTNKELQMQVTELKKERDIFKGFYNEYLMKAVRYEHAFKAVMEEIIRVKR